MFSTYIISNDKLHRHRANSHAAAMLVSPPMSRIALALLKADAIQGVQQLVQYRFKNQELPWQAVQAHRSLSFPLRNQPLAHVGDSVLRLALVEDGFHRGLSPGE